MIPPDPPISHFVRKSINSKPLKERFPSPGLQLNGKRELSKHDQRLKIIENHSKIMENYGKIIHFKFLIDLRFYDAKTFSIVVEVPSYNAWKKVSQNIYNVFRLHATPIQSTYTPGS